MLKNGVQKLCRNSCSEKRVDFIEFRTLSIKNQEADSGSLFLLDWDLSKVGLIPGQGLVLSDWHGSKESKRERTADRVLVCVCSN